VGNFSIISFIDGRISFRSDMMLSSRPMLCGEGIPEA
jgi:hypothetical protein